MIKFEEGKQYFCRFIGDSDLKIYIQVLSRTEKTLKVILNGEQKTFRINVWSDCEQIKPLGKYSMAPTITSEHEVSPPVDVYTIYGCKEAEDYEQETWML